MAKDQQSSWFRLIPVGVLKTDIDLNIQILRELLKRVWNEEKVSEEWKDGIIIKQNRSTKGCSKLKRSIDMTSSGKNGINIRTNASPKWDRTRCPGE